jgi:hypothetical protein
MIFTPKGQSSRLASVPSNTHNVDEVNFTQHSFYAFYAYLVYPGKINTNVPVTLAMRLGYMKAFFTFW